MATGTNASTACGNHLFSGAVFNSCTIVMGERSPQLPSKRKQIVIQEDDDERTCFELVIYYKICNEVCHFSLFCLSKQIYFPRFFLDRKL